MVHILRFFARGEDRPLLEDKGEIDRLYKRYRMSVMLAITVGYGIAYTCRLGLSVVKKPLIDGGIMSAYDLGVIGSGLLYGYALGKLSNGFLADHANLKRFYATGVLVSALINLAMGRTELLWIWVALWALNGWFQGFGAPTGAVSLASWFSNRERGRYYGLWSTGHAIGEGLTFVGSATLVTFFGWQAGFWGPGLICIAVAVGIYLVMQDRPRSLGLPAVADWKNDHGVPITDADGQPLKTGKAQLLILKMPTIWVLGLASATMYMTRYAINSWGFLYLQEAKGYSLVEAGGILGLNTLAGIVGCVAYGFISDHLFRARRPPVTLIFGIIEILALFVIFFSPPGQPVLLTIAFVVYGFTLSGLLAALGGLFAIDIVPKQAAGAVMGFIGVFSYVGAGIQDQISGILIEQGTTVLEGVRHYDFSAAVIYWIGGSIASMILAATLWRAKVSD
ncbi:MAG: MFS transporter [Fidelibacterota bacterium]|nr:MAG: MFS transporter [Candidatus Neomarinimicrobiota bacterium]